MHNRGDNGTAVDRKPQISDLKPTKQPVATPLPTFEIGQDAGFAMMAGSAGVNAKVRASNLVRDKRPRQGAIIGAYGYCQHPHATSFEVTRKAGLFTNGG